MAQITPVGTVDVGIFINPNTFTRQIAKSYEIVGNRINLLSTIFTSGQRSPVRISDTRWTFPVPSTLTTNGSINDSANGLDGTTIYTYAGTDYLLKSPLFLVTNNLVTTEVRPATIYESFLKMMEYIDTQIATRYQAVLSATNNGGAANTGSITFDNVKIIGAGTASGDLNGYGTMELVPSANRYIYDQYLVIDPTTPSHIHIRAGGEQDASDGVLFLGGENTHVRVSNNDNDLGNTRDNTVSIRTYNDADELSYDWVFKNDGYMSVPANKDLLDAVDGSSLTGGGNRVAIYDSSEATNYTMNGTANIILTMSGSDPISITLPDSSETYIKVGYEITIADMVGEAATSNSVGIYPNESDSILGAPGGIIIDTDYGLVNLKYVGGNHWLLMYGR
jgi:hypothetical protein